MLPSSSTCFNSRPHEEVDGYPAIISLTFWAFQLTTSRRGRPFSLLISLGETCVSTHDLTKRSTILLLILRCFFICFNSRPHEEVDHIHLLYCPDHLVFQLTTSRRGRLISTMKIHHPCAVSTHDLTKRSTAIFTQKVFLSKSLFVLIAYNIFILH